MFIYLNINLVCISVQQNATYEICEHFIFFLLVLILKIRDIRDLVKISDERPQKLPGKDERPICRKKLTNGIIFRDFHLSGF